MMIIGCDFHPSWQMISWLDTETGETGERKLMHASGEARLFYEGLTGPVRVGLESTGNSHWFVDLLTELGHEVWIGDAARIRASQVRKQKTDRRDAEHILELLVKDSFPRMWKPHRLRFASIPAFAMSICIAATTSRKVWPRWRRRAS